MGIGLARARAATRYQYSMHRVFERFFSKMMSKRREADARKDKVFVQYYKAVGDRRRDD